MGTSWSTWCCPSVAERLAVGLVDYSAVLPVEKNRGNDWAGGAVPVRLGPQAGRILTSDSIDPGFRYSEATGAEQFSFFAAAWPIIEIGLAESAPGPVSDPFQLRSAGCLANFSRCHSIAAPTPVQRSAISRCARSFLPRFNSPAFQAQSSKLLFLRVVKFGRPSRPHPFNRLLKTYCVLCQSTSLQPGRQSALWTQAIVSEGGFIHDV